MSDGGGDTGGGGFDSGGGGGNCWGSSYGNNDEHYNHNDGYHQHNDHHGDGKSGSRCPWWGSALVSGCVCLIGLGVGIAFLTISIMKESSWVSVTGTIIGKSYCGCSGGGANKNGSCQDTYAAFIEYVADDGCTYTFTENHCSSWKPTTGKEIRVLFDPDSPGEGVTGGFVGLWLIPTIALSIGAIACCVLSVIATKRSRRE
jgi:hypothetical protein